MSKRNAQLLLALLAATVLFSACAHKTSVIARVNPLYSPTFANRIAIADKTTQPVRDYEFERAVAAELERRGVKPVPLRESEYTLGYWIEKNWENGPARVVWVNSGPTPDPLAAAYGYSRPTPREPVLIDSGQNAICTAGIRLRLFVTHPKDMNRVETAWEGYIDGGLRLSADHYDILLRTLLDYFGKSYKSRVRLAE